MFLCLFRTRKNTFVLEVVLEVGLRLMWLNVLFWLLLLDKTLSVIKNDHNRHSIRKAFYFSKLGAVILTDLWGQTDPYPQSWRWWNQKPDFFMPKPFMRLLCDIVTLSVTPVSVVVRWCPHPGDVPLAVLYAEEQVKHQKLKVSSFILPRNYEGKTIFVQTLGNHGLYLEFSKSDILGLPLNSKPLPSYHPPPLHTSILGDL